MGVKDIMTKDGLHIRAAAPLATPTEECGSTFD